MTGATTMEGSDVLTRLRAASSAEDFFSILGLPYEETVVRVARLHILKRMGQYLAREDFSGLSPETITARCRANLERAYADFTTSTPIEQRVFKVLREAVEPKTPATFVPFDTLLK
ncbi:MAG: nitrogenase stabilizing/protective protein NifW [Hyphomicrobium sp.]|jgi:nitrogenase-stabilizing/protective protein